MGQDAEHEARYDAPFLNMTLGITFPIHCYGNLRAPLRINSDFNCLKLGQFQSVLDEQETLDPRQTESTWIVCFLLNGCIFNNHVHNEATRLPIILKQSSRTIHLHVVGVCATVDCCVSSVCTYPRDSTCLIGHLHREGPQVTHTPFWIHYLLKMYSPEPSCDMVVSVCKIKSLKEERGRETKKKLTVCYTKCKNLFVKKCHIVFQSTFIKSPQICPGELIFIQFALTHFLNWNLVPLWGS